MSKDRVDQNSTISQIHLFSIYRTLHPTTEHTFFSTSYGTFTERDHILGYEIHPNRFKRVEITQSMVSAHSGIRLEINNRKIAGKSPNS